MPIKKDRKRNWKILFVEDGSIDVDDLQQFIDDNNIEIKICVYRAGSCPPHFLDETVVAK